MFEHPYFLAITVLAVAFLFYRQHRYYLTHAYVKALKATQQRFRLDWRSAAQKLFVLIGWLCLIVAASGMTWGFVQPTKKQQVHKYVLVNDGSGSMVDGGKPQGKGKQLQAVHTGNVALLDMLSQRDDGSKDSVGAVVFSNDAFIVSYLVDDPKFIEKNLGYVDYRQWPMAGGTNLEKALWCGMEMLIRDGKKADDDDVFALQRAMYGQGEKYARNEKMSQLVHKYIKIVEGGSIVIFTDGMFSPQGHATMMSTFKLLDLCKELHIRVYLISVEMVDQQVSLGLKETGGFGVVLTSFDERSLQKAYEDVVKSQSQEEIVVDQPVRRPLSPIFAAVAFVLISVGLLLRLTLNRSYTEV